MTYPKFSIVIPTRQRHDTLPSAIQSVLNQTYQDFEVVVMDNCSTSETADVAAKFTDERVKYYRSPVRLSMDANWEAGVNYATGEYIFVLGDDDAMLPDGLELVDLLLNKYSVKIVSWYRNQYHWGHSQSQHDRNRLSLSLNQAVSLRSCHQSLIDFYQVEPMFEYLPMIYNSFIHRRLIEKIKSIHGKYFLPVVPDVASGIANAYFSDYFVYSFRSISLAGLSQHSTGTSVGKKQINSKPFEDYLKELDLGLGEKDRRFHDAIGHSENLELTVGNCQFLTKEKFFPHDDSITVNMRSLLNFTARLINRDPNEYELTLEQIKLLAVKHQIPLSDIAVPAKTFFDYKAIQGVFGNEYGAHSLIINCEQNGIKDAANAAMLAQSIWNSIDRLQLPVEFPVLPAHGNSQQLVKFAIDGVFFQLYNTGIARVWRSLLEEWANSDILHTPPEAGRCGLPIRDSEESG